MLAHLEAIIARLTALNAAYRGYLGAADPNTMPPYFIVSGPAADPGDDRPITPESAAIDTDVRIKAVAGTVSGVYSMLALARADLSPNLAPAPLAVTGRKAETRWERGEFVDVDPTVTIAATNKHPALGVDTYRLTSEPV